MRKIDITHITFDKIEWVKRESGLHVSIIYLYPDQQLDIEVDWVVHGPCKVLALWYPNTRWVRLKTTPLPKRLFNLDDPLEYPCRSCGAPRLSPCVGERKACTWRVFYMRGGEL